MPTWAPVLLQWLALPFVGGAVLWAARFLSPTARWTRQIRSDQAIYADLPEGEVKQRLGEKIEQQTSDLLDYRELMPRRMKFENVVSAGWIVLVVGMFVVMGPKAFFDSMFTDGLQGLFLFLAAMPMPLIFTLRAILGQPVAGTSIREYLESERIREAQMIEEHRAQRSKKAASARKKIAV